VEEMRCRIDEEGIEEGWKLQHRIGVKENTKMLMSRKDELMKVKVELK